MNADSPDAGARWAGRHRARAVALQALYECEVGGLTPQQAIGVLVHAGAPEVDDPGADEHAFVVSMVRGAFDGRDALDERIGDAAKNWRVERMAVLDRLVMRLALHELLTHKDSPPRVVISEAIELARAYSGEDAAKFVNGVLDGAYRRLKEEGLVTD
ncbi:MAG TPA: transcription antitermination factor NusB [Vicinamibacterales bacterium]|nr:transcription antitermination factor NusB [Vicinamibacterales bacterium]